MSVWSSFKRKGKRVEKKEKKWQDRCPGHVSEGIKGNICNCACVSVCAQNSSYKKSLTFLQPGKTVATAKVRKIQYS